MTHVQHRVKSDPLITAGRRVERPVLQELMEVALQHPICVVIGVAGWGKSAAVASWVGDSPTVWLRPDGSDADINGFLRTVQEALRPHLSNPAARPSLDRNGEAAVAAVAEDVCGWLGRFLHEDVVLVLDDLQGLPPNTDLARLVDGLCRHAPARLRMVLVSRQELPFSLDRLRGQGLVAEIHAPDLAFNVSDVALLLETTVGLDPPGLPRRIWERTGGWPAAVYCAVEMLRGVPVEQRLARVEFVARPGERFHNFLTEEVLSSEPEHIRALLHRLSVLGEIRSAPDRAPDDVLRTLAELTRRGLVTGSSDGSGRWSLVRPLADYFTYESDLPVTQRVRLHATAAQECIRRGAYADAVRHLVAAGDHEACVTLLIGHGDALVNSGRADAVLEAGRLPREHLQNPTVLRVLGRARQARGQWTTALECFRRAGLDGPRLEPALAWCAGLVAFSRGELRAVLGLTGRARLVGEDTAEATQVLTLAAAAHRMSGNLPAAHAAKTRASTAARRSGEGRVRAALHLVMAMVDAAEGDHRQAAVNFSIGATSAEAEDDLLQSLWIQICRAFHTLDQGAPRLALAEVQSPLRMSRKCGDPFLTAHALTTSGRAKVRLGMLESAQADLAGAVDLFQRISSRFLAWPLAGLGDLYRVRGQPVRARAAYEEALALAEPGGDVLATASGVDRTGARPSGRRPRPRPRVGRPGSGPGGGVARGAGLPGSRVGRTARRRQRGCHGRRRAGRRGCAAAARRSGVGRGHHAHRACRTRSGRRSPPCSARR
jgi:ATP/maltotriose-dependent transcriptional regulator MalT